MGTSDLERLLGKDTRAYRAYLLTHQDRIFRAEDILAASDYDAIRIARRLADKHPVELWERDRLVHRIEPGSGEHRP